MASGKWSIVAEPQARNTGGKNEGGIVLYVVNPSGGGKSEVSRVAFIRRNSKNPKNSLAVQLQREVARARTAVDILNSQLSGTGELL